MCNVDIAFALFWKYSVRYQTEKKLNFQQSLNLSKYFNSQKLRKCVWVDDLLGLMIQQNIKDETFLYETVTQLFLA